jgi:hypothetical protein
MASMVVTASEFSPASNMLYTKPKANNAGGKSVGILNTLSRKALYIQTPLMMCWGANEYDNPGGKSYDMCLQFPREEFSNPATQQFLKVMLEFEAKIKADARANSRDWLGKANMSEDVIDALFSPMLKYPKDANGEPDKSRSPTLKVKLPLWSGEYKFDLFDTQNNKLLTNTGGSDTPTTLIPKGSEVACIMICGGVWFANGKFGVTWKAYQIVVKPSETLEKGICHIKLDDSMPAIKSDPTLTEPTTYDSDGEEPPSNVVVSDPVKEEEPATSTEAEKPKKVSKKGVKA